VVHIENNTLYTLKEYNDIQNVSRKERNPQFIKIILKKTSSSLMFAPCKIYYAEVRKSVNSVEWFPKEIPLVLGAWKEIKGSLGLHGVRGTMHLKTKGLYYVLSVAHVLRRITGLLK
jgi:hypothetical protein